MIAVKYSSIDRFSERRKFKTLAGARAYAQKWVGKNPDCAPHYAISDDGVGKIEVEGVALAELFGDVKAQPKGGFAIFVEYPVYDGRDACTGSESRMLHQLESEEEAVQALDYEMRNDGRDEAIIYGCSWAGDKWVKWPAPTYNGLTAAEIVDGVAIDLLSAEFAAWQAKNALPAYDAQEMLIAGGLTAEQIAFVQDFIERWEAAAKADPKFYDKQTVIPF